MEAEALTSEPPGKPRTYIKLSLKMHSNIHWVQTNTVLFPLYEVPRIVKFIESESPLADPRGQGLGWERRKNGELWFNGDRVSV